MFIVGFYLCILLRVTDKLEIIEDKVIDANERFAQMGRCGWCFGQVFSYFFSIRFGQLSSFSTQSL